MSTLWLRVTLSVLISIVSFVNGQGQLNFHFSEPIVITKEAVNISTCSIIFNEANTDDRSYYIAYTEFDEVDEQRFEDRTYAAQILSQNSTTLSLANFTFKTPRFDRDGDKEGYEHQSHLPLFRGSDFSDGSTLYNTYNPSVAAGYISSFAVYDSFHPNDDQMWIEYNNLNLSQFGNLGRHSNYGHPMVKLSSQSSNTEDLYLLAYANHSINQTDIIVSTIEIAADGEPIIMVQNTAMIHPWLDSPNIVINNTRIAQDSGEHSAWIIGYDVTGDISSLSNDTGGGEIYGHPFWWDVGQKEFGDEPTLLSDEGCPINWNGDCTKKLQAIVHTEEICSDATAPKTAYYLVIYTVDDVLVMDLISFDHGGNGRALSLDRVWPNSFYVAEDNGNLVYIGDIQDSNTVSLNHVDLSDLETTNLQFDSEADYYILTYVGKDNLIKFRSFGIKGCEYNQEPEMLWLGIPYSGPSIANLNSWPSSTDSFVDSSLCMAQPHNDPKSMIIAWFEWGDKGLVIEPSESNQGM